MTPRTRRAPLMWNGRTIGYADVTGNECKATITDEGARKTLPGMIGVKSAGISIGGSSRNGEPDEAEIVIFGGKQP